ncbi:hypothetical protein OAO87_04760 [bacterium]|nr:hypothetical protein [bacterium]
MSRTAQDTIWARAAAAHLASCTACEQWYGYPTHGVHTNLRLADSEVSRGEASRGGGRADRTARRSVRPPVVD